MLYILKQTRIAREWIRMLMLAQAGRLPSDLLIAHKWMQMQDLSAGGTPTVRPAYRTRIETDALERPGEVAFKVILPALRAALMTTVARPFQVLRLCCT